MKSRKKRMMLFMTALMFVAIFLIGCTPEEILPPVDHSTVHLYLIGGQSNAVGISPVATAVEADMSRSFENVSYAGETDYVIATGVASSSFGLKATAGGVPAGSFSADFVSVKAGLGRTSGHFGPEYGMAETLNSRYESERKAFFFKFAAGGTSVRNVYAGDYNAERYGNWYTRSLKAELGAGEINAGTGILYERFIDNFEIAYEKLVEAGHDVRIMGMIWMQGESDRATPEMIADYPRLFGALVADLREDISTITGMDYSCMPLIAGEVSDTHGIARGSNTEAFDAEVAKNRAFNAMLNAIEDNQTISDFYVAEAHDMVQNKLVGGQAESLNTADPADPWHWIADYMVTLGHRFADKLIEVCS